MSGRPPRLLEESIRKQIVQSIENGTPYIHAAQAAGISDQTLMLWKRNGKAAEKKEEAGEELSEREALYLSFLRDVRIADAKAVERNVALIQIAARDTWQAAAWYLERRYPADFARKDRLEHSGPGGSPMEVRAALMKELMQDAEAGGPQPTIVDDAFIVKAVEAEVARRLEHEGNGHHESGNGNGHHEPGGNGEQNGDE